MDPDATLAEIRDYLARYRREYDHGTSDEALDAATDLADSVAALLEWLAKGGFAPDWRRAA